MNNSIQQLVVFSLDDLRFALPLSVVERVIRVVDISPLPKAPEIVMGIINLQGQPIPVVDIRQRFRLPKREIALSDQIIISRTSRRTIGIVVDGVAGVIECREQEITDAGKLVPGIEYVEGVARLEDGMILIHNIERFLSIEEEESLSDAIQVINNA